jgi:hypothetical protein
VVAVVDVVVEVDADVVVELEELLDEPDCRWPTTIVTVEPFFCVVFAAGLSERTTPSRAGFLTLRSRCWTAKPAWVSALAACAAV